MALSTLVLTVMGGTLLTHSVYSAYEHSVLLSHVTSPASKPTIVPTDIAVETLLATIILLFSIVFNSAPLRPIHWVEWAGKIEREGWDPNAPAGEERSVNKGKGATGNPYRALEERRGFWDVRKSRREFAEWVKQGEGKERPVQ
ncbi:MAG: hypothetical protein Q9159_001992 [Coniocarpon cinnabarinum]